MAHEVPLLHCLFKQIFSISSYLKYVNYVYVRLMLSNYLRASIKVVRVIVHVTAMT